MGSRGVECGSRTASVCRNHWSLGKATVLEDSTLMTALTAALASAQTQRLHLTPSAVPKAPASSCHAAARAPRPAQGRLCRMERGTRHPALGLARRSNIFSHVSQCRNVLQWLQCGGKWVTHILHRRRSTDGKYICFHFRVAIERCKAWKQKAGEGLGAQTQWICSDKRVVRYLFSYHYHNRNHNHEHNRKDRHNLVWKTKHCASQVPSLVKKKA